MNEKRRYWFEDVPEEQRFYFLVQYAREGEPEAKGEDQGEARQRSVFEPNPKIEEMLRRQHEVGFVPGTLSPPVWCDVEDRPDPHTPRIFTTRARAEKRRRYHEDPDIAIQAYVESMEEHGEETVNRALDNSAPLRVVWTTQESLLGALAYAEFSHLQVDDQVVSAHAFTRELRGKLEESS